MLDSLNTLIAFALIMTVVSLLITIVVQMISNALNLRGRNLAKAMTQILQTTAPGPSNEVKKAAERVTGYLLTRPQLSDHAFFNIFQKPDGQSEEIFAKENYKLPKFWLNRFATAVRPQEVFDTLIELAKRPDQGDKTLARDARALLKRMGISIAYPKAVDQTIEALAKVQDHLKQMPDGEKLVAAIEEGRNSIVAAANAGMNQAATTVTEAWERFNFWFEATQDRAQQWFAMHTRCWTILFALIFAFVCELDTIEIYQKVSSDRVLRDTLVASAATFTSQAEKVLGDTPTVLQDAFNVWHKKQTDPTIAPLIAELDPQATETRGSFLARLQSALAAQPGAAELMADFGKVLDETIQDRLNQQSAQFVQLKDGLENSGFPLVVRGGRWAGEKDAKAEFLPWYNFWEGRPWLRHFWGMLMTAGLLTLGAPFWFNTLKSLTNLRSLVARDISKEEQTKIEAATKPNAAVPPPPTTTLPPPRPATSP